MIGFDTGGGGGRVRRGRLGELWNDAVDFIEDVARIVWRWVTDVVRWVRITIQHLFGVTMERWVTRHDERTCPQCGGLDGQVWPQNEGEFPPLHDNCRCERRYSHTEWRTREESRWQRQVHGRWQLTHWS